MKRRRKRVVGHGAVEAGGRNGYFAISTYLEMLVSAFSRNWHLFWKLAKVTFEPGV